MQFLALFSCLFALFTLAVSQDPRKGTHDSAKCGRFTAYSPRDDRAQFEVNQCNPIGYLISYSINDDCRCTIYHNKNHNQPGNCADTSLYTPVRDAGPGEYFNFPDNQDQFEQVMFAAYYCEKN
jgi:hypothetical protein